jgi:hypothetical protein
LEDLDIKGIIILKWILKKWGREHGLVVWLKIRTGDGLM